MKLSISNIAWDTNLNKQIYELMHKYNFKGLEIAPTKIFPEKPYENLDIAKKWMQELKDTYELIIPSMQSIWFGKSEKIFKTKEERQILINYTKKAIDFASIIDCKNLVFGCPKNRNIEKDSDYQIAIEFFKALGDYAYSKNTVIGMEANPVIYNTNFINDTQSAIKLIKDVNSKGFLLNLDFSFTSKYGGLHVIISNVSGASSVFFMSSFIIFIWFSNLFIFTLSVAKSATSF